MTSAVSFVVKIQVFPPFRDAELCSAGGLRLRLAALQNYFQAAVTAAVSVKRAQFFARPFSAP